MYENLLEPIKLGPTWIPNRIFNPPHGTTLGSEGIVTDNLIAYHEARASGGVGLIILEGMAFHPSFEFESAYLNAGRDTIIPGLKKLSTACREHGTLVFGQLFHAGRAVRYTHDGSKPLIYSPSDIPDDRYRVVPRPMPNEMVWEVIDSYAKAAVRLAEADLDGVEILASMGYLIAQFLNPATNRREDEFGGSFENRLRFLRETVTQTRKAIGQGKTLGIRITLDEKTDTALDPDEVIKICSALEEDDDLDYFSVIAGSSSSPAGWIHVFPPMAIPHAYVADDAARLKNAVSKPVLVAGRINQPQTASEILSEGKADMIGMARALIADPEFVKKVAQNRSDHIRACIGCNQACVGHRLTHHPISCIQNPRTGREQLFQNTNLSQSTKTVMVIGGGPGGMKAAVTAAEHGHRVLLFEQQARLGGQVNLAELLPGRAEFGGVTTNLVHELERNSVDVYLNSTVSSGTVNEFEPDAIIVATGAVTRLPEVEVNNVELVHAWSVIQRHKKIGQNVVIADWACDWTGLGVAHKLVQEGHHVRLLSGASIPGESIPGIVRDQWIGELQSLNVELINFARFFGAQDCTAYFQHMINGEPIICENVDTIVSCYAPQSNRECDWLFESTSTHKQPTLIKVGDALVPRTVEEAVLDGLQAAWSLQ